MRATSPEARSRRVPWRSWLALVAGGLLLAGCSVALGPDAGSTLPQDALNPAGPVAREQDELWNYVFAVAVGVFVLVQAGILYVVFRFRDRGETDLPKQVHGNTRLEILWTIIPAVILAFIAVPTVQTIFQLADPPAEDALMVDVVGKQYWWEFTYVDEGVRTANELHIPTGREVFIRLDGTAVGNDVIHSFWVPRLAGKQDYVPGDVLTMRIEADEPGEYPGQCAEFCGLSHANMRFTVVAHEPADWAAYMDGLREPANEPADDLVAQGAEIAGQQCTGCHTITGNPGDADARIAPNLTHFALRERFAGYIVDTNEENLRRWVTNPQDVKPGAQMPAFGPTDDGGGLSEEEIDAVVAYLLSLD